MSGGVSTKVCSDGVGPDGSIYFMLASPGFIQYASDVTVSLLVFLIVTTHALTWLREKEKGYNKIKE